MKTNVEMKFEITLSYQEVETLRALSCYATGLSRGEFEERFGKKANRSLNECLAIQFSELLIRYEDAANCLYNSNEK